MCAESLSASKEDAHSTKGICGIARDIGAGYAGTKSPILDLAAREMARKHTAF
jgi:hypothetical protein